MDARSELGSDLFIVQKGTVQVVRTAAEEPKADKGKGKDKSLPPLFTLTIGTYFGENAVVQQEVRRAVNSSAVSADSWLFISGSTVFSWHTAHTASSSRWSGLRGFFVRLGCIALVLNTVATAFHQLARCMRHARRRWRRAHELDGTDATGATQRRGENVKSVENVQLLMLKEHDLLELCTIYPKVIARVGCRTQLLWGWVVLFLAERSTAAKGTYTALSHGVCDVNVGRQIAAELRATYLHRTKLIHKASGHHYISLRKRLMKIQLEETLKGLSETSEAAPKCVASVGASVGKSLLGWRA